jgi:ABC-type multidrug transport system fused ATPase/permease subunit
MKTFQEKSKNLSDFFSATAYCLSLSWKSSRFYTIVRITGQILLSILTIAVSYIGKYIIDLLTGVWAPNDKKQMLFILFFCLLIVTVFRSLGQKVMLYCQSMQSDKINGYLSARMISQSLKADLEYIDNPKFHDKFTSTTRDLSMTAHILWNVLSCLSAMVSFLISFIILSRLSIFYGLIVIVAAIPSSIATAKYTKVLFDLSLEQLNGERKKSYYQSLAIDRNYAQDLRLFNAERYLRNRYTILWKKLFEEKKKITKIRTIFTCLLELLPELAVIIIGINIALGVMSGFNTVGDYSLYTSLISQLWAAISLLSSSALQIYDNQIKLINIKEFENFKNHVIETGNIRLERIDSITFDHVSFSYPGANFLALDDINIQLCCEEKVALVGLNGSGKSTLIKLLLRFYDPDAGAILINGINIKEYSLAELRSNFSVYFQEMQNYSFTLRDNFTISNQEIGDDDRIAQSALAKASCDDILRKVNGNLDTSITRLFDEEGVELSGGQHQKLALARAFFRRHTALILDEPSSNLDPKAEHMILQSLHTLTQGKMTIFTSHRLSNVFLSDRIIVLENGKIIEDGTQEELLKNKQRYSELFRYQQEKYITGDKSNADSIN